MGPVAALEPRAQACARRLAEAESVVLASHIDADGLTSAAIASRALERAGIAHEVVFKKQLDDAEIATIAARDAETVLFTDFGSGQLEAITAHERAGDFTPVVVDHHQPADADTEFHLNPLLEGIDGAAELSGAGASYLLARALADVAPTEELATAPAADPDDLDSAPTAAGPDDPDSAPTASGPDDPDSAPTASAPDNPDSGPTAPDTDNPDSAPTAAGPDARASNRDLAALAVVGAVGDMQASATGELTGANRAIVAEGVEAGVLEEATDLALYGKQTRPLPKLLEYASEVRVPGVSNDSQGAVSFLQDLPVDAHDGEHWRRWVDLSAAEKQTVASALLQRALERGVPAAKAQQLVGTTYTLPGEPAGTELRDASEFSTLLNATARYERADVGLAVCLGHRDGALDRARRLLTNHRRNLSEGLDTVTEVGVEQLDNLQYFDAGEQIRETIVGIVAGMALGTEGVDSDRPIIAFAHKSAEETKVSARGTGRLVGQGLDLSAVVGEAARSVGGDGGGHDIAAGATVPAGKEEDFVEAADALVAEQLSG